MSDLDDILNGNDVEESVEAVEAVEAEVIEEVAEVEKGETTTPKVETEESWTKAAVLDERRKRQDLERQLEALKTQQLKAPEPRPDVFDDQDKAFQYTERSIEQKLINQKIEMSQELMRSMHDDYDELESEFVDIVKENPSLIAEMNRHAMPAKFVREVALKHRNLKEVDNVPTYQARIKELEAQLASVTQKSPVKIPTSLTAKASKGGTNDAGIGESLADILGR